MKFPAAFTCAFLLLSLWSFPAAAEETRGVTVTTAVQREVEVTNEKGEREIRLEDVKTAVPGEELVVLISYTNTGDQPAENIVLINPVSEQMIYLAGSAEGQDTDVNFSVDEGATFDVPDRLFVTDEKGEARPAGPADYTHVRWTRSKALGPGAQGQVRFKAVIR